MEPRDPYDPPDVDRYDEPYNRVGVGGDVTDLVLDVQEEGLSDEQILKYSVRFKLKLYPGKNVLMTVRHLTVMGFPV